MACGCLVLQAIAHKMVVAMVLWVMVVVVVMVVEVVEVVVCGGWCFFEMFL